MGDSESAVPLPRLLCALCRRLFTCAYLGQQQHGVSCPAPSSAGAAAVGQSQSAALASAIHPANTLVIRRVLQTSSAA
jgi:hypothetical protein